MPQHDEALGRTLAKGALAGVAAVGALVATRNALWARESPELRAREMALREGAEETGLQKPVRALARRTGLPLSREAEVRAAKALAWTLGAAGVVGYALARRRFARARAAWGLGFGAAVWLAEDEALWPMLGLAEGPRAYPWQAHARGLAAHLAYGAAAESALRALSAKAARAA